MQTLVDAKQVVFAQMVKQSPKFASKLLFWKKFKHNINLENPQTFNEKLMWLKLYEDLEYKAKLSDKVEMRNYITTLGLEQLLVPMIDIVDYVEDIIFEQLPRRFVLKCTHGPEFTIICTDKRQLDYPKTRQQLAQWMAIDYSLINAEIQYANIKPQIIIEHFIGPANNEMPITYKIHCFHGAAKIIELAVKGKNSKEQSMMLTPDWQDTHYMKVPFTCDAAQYKPQQLEELLALAQKISKTSTYMRVDFSIVEGEIYFDELLFTPAACLNDAIHEQANQLLGQWLNLNIGKKKQPVSYVKETERYLLRVPKKFSR